MKQLTAVLVTSLLFLAGWVNGVSAQVLAPQIEGPWIPIAGNPDLGKYTSPRQQPVDFCIWQAADGTWQLWSCIRGTKCGGHTRLFYRWEGKTLTERNWKPMGIAMEADPSVGESAGGLQAPYVVRVSKTYHLFYGDWEHICHATSDDGKTFKRVVGPSGKTGLFTEGIGFNTRDIVMMPVGDRWYGYYTAYPNRQGAVYMRTTRDFKTWSESTTVAFGGITGTNPYSAECPHVIHRHGRYYLFRTQRYGPANISTVYHSTDPAMFGINQDRRYLLTRLAVAAPEIVQHEGVDYIAALNPGLDGIRLAKLKWGPPPRVGAAVIDFDKEETRAAWRLASGNLASVFTQSKRTGFFPPKHYFIGTAEIDSRTFDDDRTGEIVCKPFVLKEDRYFAYVSGGAKRNRVYVALCDAETGKELLRIASPTDSNRLEPALIDTSSMRGRRVHIKVVDQAQGGWGHINFGGLFKVE